MNILSINANKLSTIVIAVLTLLVTHISYGQIKLPKIISSNMVLQRNTDVKIWGWSERNETVTLDASWLENPMSIKSNQTGKWIAVLATTNSKDAQTLKITDKTSEIFLENILFGEVWICSGQSNMERNFVSMNGEPVFHSLQTIAHSSNVNLRLFTIERNSSKSPEQTLSEVKSWTSADPNSVPDFSAVAYFFGNQLQKILDVPVGLIHSSWGGSDIIAWMAEDELSKYKKFNLDTIELNQPRDARKAPTMLFNAMIHPISDFTVKGALWYQGESNRHEPKTYLELLPAMVENWRDLWNQGDFPFYYVQIAPYSYRNPQAYHSPENSAFLREAQLLALEKIPNSGMAVTLDLGQEDNIHPPKKREVGDRLLYLALKNTYGFSTVDADGPKYKSMEIKGDSLLLSFDFSERGLYSPEGLEDFQVAGVDHVFYPAKASLIERGKRVLLISEKVDLPVAARYGWSNWVMGSLFDTNLLPASSFRTDDWDDAKKANLKD